METGNDTDRKDKIGRMQAARTFSFIYLSVCFSTWKSLVVSIMSYLAIGPHCTTSVFSVPFSSSFNHLSLYLPLQRFYRTLQVFVTSIVLVPVTDSDSRYQCSSFKATTSLMDRVEIRNRYQQRRFTCY